MKNKLTNVIQLILSITVIVSSLVYLLTQKMIPGLMPLALAFLMLLMLKKEFTLNRKTKVTKVLFFTAFILNLIAGISQIIVSFTSV